MEQDLDAYRIMTRVARLYYDHGARQTEIASRLGISQARVSRLISAAKDSGIVRTVVMIPDGLHTAVEEAVESRYGMNQVHVVETLDDGDLRQTTRDLGAAAASLLTAFALDGRTIGFTSWSRSLRAMTAVLEPMRRASGSRVVEMLGDVGPPRMQHEATRATQRFADQLGATALFLRIPGVAATASLHDALLDADAHTLEAVEALNHLDIALAGIGTCAIDPPLEPGGNFFTQEQFDSARDRGAVGQVNLRFIDEQGAPVLTELDDLVVGATLAQMRAAERRMAVAGGRAKYSAVRAAIRGQWIETLVTDLGTAERLLNEPS